MDDIIKDIIYSVIFLTPIGFTMAMIYPSMGILGVILYLFLIFLARPVFELYIESGGLDRNSVHNKKTTRKK